MIRSLVRATPIYPYIRELRRRVELRNWDNQSAPIPHLIKQRIVGEYAARYGLKVLVETGTYYGDMVFAMRNSFDQIYTIELSERLYMKAKSRFRSAAHISVIHGDSGEVLRTLVPTLRQPALFWLDSHYSAGVTARGSKDTPIIEEIDAITKSGLKHVLLIDDARCFGTDQYYPTLQELHSFIKSRREVSITVAQDLIRVTPDGE